MINEVLAFSPTDNPDHPGAQRLKRSAERWGWKHTFVEQGGWDRYSYKAEQEGTLKFLKTLDLTNPPFVMYMDAWDTAFVGPQQELPLREGTLYFCGDGKCFPDDSLKPLFDDVLRGQFPFLNAGVIWGDPRVLLKATEEYLTFYAHANVCNQTFFTMNYLKDRVLGCFQYPYLIDHNASWVLNLWDLYDEEQDSHSPLGLKGKRLWYKDRNTTPVVLHAAGSSVFHELPPMPRWLDL